MPTTDVTTMVLRFRDLGIPPGETIQSHFEVIEKEGLVWWGWWSKSGEQVPDEVFRALKTAAQAGGIKVYLFDSGQMQIHSAVCRDIEWEGDHSRIGSPDPKKTPVYYKKREYLAWFQLRDIALVAEGEKELQGLTCIQVDEFFTDRPSRYTPFYNKRIDSTGELKQQDRTIWFVRPLKSGDATNAVSLLDSDRVTPAHFPRHVLESPSSNLLLTSDVHFSLDGHHAFPVVSAHDKFDLGHRIEITLTENGVKSLAGVIVAGDLTWRATAGEYDQVLAFFKRLNSWAKLRNYQFMVCPGNHDLAFSDDPSKKDKPIQVVPADARKPYEQFYESQFYLKPNEHLSSGRRFLLGNVPVDVVALNSSLLEQHKGFFQGHGFVGEMQLRHAAEEIGWKLEQPANMARAFRVVVVHHHLLPVTYSEQAKYGGVYSVALDAEAVIRWAVSHRVDLVVHGHMHHPFTAKVSRPLKMESPGGEWHTFQILGLGSAGVELSHLGEEKNNTFAVLNFAASGAVEVKVYTIHPTNPSKILWQMTIPVRGGAQSCVS